MIRRLINKLLKPFGLALIRITTVKSRPFTLGD